MPAPEAASIVRVADFRPCDCIPIGFNRKRFVSDSLHFRPSRCEKTALKQLPLRGSALESARFSPLIAHIGTPRVACPYSFPGKPRRAPGVQRGWQRTYR